MTEPPRVYRIDGEYEDRKLGNNEFVRWLGIKNAGGMRPMLRKRSRVRGNASELAALVLITRHVSGKGYNPWQDVIDRRHGHIWYWGDAKADPHRGRDDFDGNRFLSAIWQAIGERRFADVPPILHFSKYEKGVARFNGLCVLGDLRDAWFEDQGVRVRNYQATLDVLPVDRVSVGWLRSRVEGTAEVNVPREWAIYSSTGRYERLVLWANLVKSESEQLPGHGTDEWRLLEQIHALPPIVAENLIVRAFQEAPIAHDIRATPPTKDGGFDFHGAFKLPPPLGYSVAIKGEVKRYAPTNRVGPKDVARLVARLRRGEQGVFVTTSSFTDQCQEEVFADAYPVELIPGGRLVGLLQQLGAVRGSRLADEWLTTTPIASIDSANEVDASAYPLRDVPAVLVAERPRAPRDRE